MAMSTVSTVQGAAMGEPEGMGAGKDQDFGGEPLISIKPAKSRC